MTLKNSRSRSRSRGNNRGRSRSRSNNGYLKSKLVGGFLRAGVPTQTLVSSNPLVRHAPYDILENVNKCQKGGDLRIPSRKKKNTTIYYKYVL